ncbi:LacI family DNA-binding transcriptional regulator [Arenicella xantha]|uniref:LacI family transcriptional regulator n=1 Tax=Arenicella xantha TaxID=644221 RepID=A0A395JMX2_9GAMM|nr:LacI family DNA-binding transcriptional regulator [Arenicella xantha]RBP53014.1 LacI family transcriptional regulator [Arenicella xantha]
MNDLRDKKATINDVARLAEVSKRTVSRVINKSTKVGEKTRVRVQKIMDDLDYSPNAQARGLAARRSYLLGLIYDNPDALYINDVQRGVLSICREFGYELVVHPCDMTSDRLIDEAVSFVNRSKLDGVVILPPISENNDLAGALGKAHVNYVRLASIALDTAEHVVISNERSAAAAMAEYLVRLGHRRIGYIAGPKRMRSTRERLEGFCDALEMHGCKPEPDMIALGAYTFESGINCTRELLANKNPPTAIFASNDEMAVGAINAAQDMGLKVPGDLSVAGFDDSILASRIMPPLTTLRRPVQEMARLATSKLIASIDGRKEEASSSVMLVPSLIKRQSTQAID